MQISKSKVISLILILFFINACTIRKYERYRFNGYKLTLKNFSNKDIMGIISVNNTYKYIKTGVLRDKIIYKEPYFYDTLAIYGNFDKIENLEAYFIQNKTKKIPILILAEDINKNKKKLSNEYEFSYKGKNLLLPITWDETESLEAEANFIGVVNGKRKKYKLKGEYKKELIIEHTTPILEALMGV